MNTRGLAALAAAAVVLCACVHEEDFSAAPPEEPGDVARGRVLVEERCAGCHAVGLTGASPYPAAPPLRTLPQKYDVEGLAEAFAEGILVFHKGEKPMPEFQMPPEEIDDLIAYLKSLSS